MAAAVATGSCLLAPASASLAADWSADTSLIQTFEASDNRLLSPAPIGGTLTSINELLLNVTALGPTTRFDFNGNVNYRAYMGPGAANDINTLGNNLRMRYEERFKLFDYFVSGSWNRTDASTVQLDEFGFSTVSGEINTYTVESGTRVDLTALDTLNFTATGSFSQFANGSTTTSNQTAAVWTRRLNPNTDWNTSVQFNWVARDDTFSSETTLWTVMTGLRTDLTPHLTLVGNAGAGIAPPGSGNVAPIFGSALDSSGGGTAVDWLANARLIYTLKTTQFAIFAAKSVSPTTFGEFQQSMNAGFTVRQEINWNSSITIYGNFARNTAATTGSYDLYSASVAYDYQLARDWNAQLSYRYQQRISPEFTAQSNTVIGRLTYNYTILP